MRPIDADALEKTLRDWIRDHWTEAFTGDDVGAEFADMIEHAETIDTNPTVHAHWIPCENETGEQDDENRSNSNAQTDTRARGMGATDKSSGI